MDFAEIRKLVLSVDDEKITEQLVEQLIKYLPNKDEMMQLTTYKDKINDLSDAERFGVIVSPPVLFRPSGQNGHFCVFLRPMQMSDVKRLPERLDCMLFRVRFAEELSELQPVSVSHDSHVTQLINHTLFVVLRAYHLSSHHVEK